MAASETEILNGALILLGANTVTSPTENNKNARVTHAAYAGVRDAELRTRRWKFSIKRQSLPALTSEPDSDYARQFQLPTDYLRLIEGGDIADVADLSDYRTTAGTGLYSIENGLLLTNLAAPVSIRYLARITDTTVFDAAFDRALKASLAYECCEAITQSDSKQELCRLRYKEAIRDAVRANAIEAPPQGMADDTWLAARAQ